MLLKDLEKFVILNAWCLLVSIQSLQKLAYFRGPIMVSLCLPHENFSINISIHEYVFHIHLVNSMFHDNRSTKLHPVCGVLAYTDEDLEDPPFYFTKALYLSRLPSTLGFLTWWEFCDFPCASFQEGIF